MEFRLKYYHGNWNPWIQTDRDVESIKNTITQPQVEAVQWRENKHTKIHEQKHKADTQGWHGESQRHREARQKALGKTAINESIRTTTAKPKDIWLSIRSNEMMWDTMKALIQEIKSHNIQYTSYASGNGNRLYLHLKNCPESFKKELGNWIYYQPVTQMKKPPNISDYDVTDW